MNILIICSYFPPDLSIGAVRPYMFAKYLCEFGHNVTVLCSKKTSSHLKDTLYSVDDIGAKVVYYDIDDNSKVKNLPSFRDRLPFLSSSLYNKLAKLYHRVFYRHYFETNHKIFNIERERFKFSIDKLHDNSFDIIFSTFPNLEVLYSGIYAKDKFNSKLVMDFRDLIVGSALENWYNNKYMLSYEQELVKKCDYITCVSNYNAETLKERYDIKNIEVINNGFDEFYDKTGSFFKDNIFRICYTGGLKLDFQQNMLIILLNSLSKLIDNNSIDVNSIEVLYAGSDSKIFSEIVQNLGLYKITHDYGLLTREETFILQDECDVFVVLSKNTKKVKGIISGKFYEGVRMKKSILSLVDGDVSNSELYKMYEKYNYGYCYENSRSSNSLIKLEEFLTDMYNYKIKNNSAKVYITDEIYNDFLYKNLARKLENSFLKLLSN